MKLKTNPKFEEAFEKYPSHIKEKMSFLRQLIWETASEMSDIDTLEETLKWGEPSFVTKNGSTLRIYWSDKKPEQYGMYFQCTSRLVPTFRLVYSNIFEFEGNRAIIFGLNHKIPTLELKECIKAALHYHDVKKYETLGI